MLADHLIVTIGALILDGLFDTSRLFHRVGHPVQWIGALIAWADRHLNRGARWGGVVTVLLLLLPAGVLFFLPLPPLAAAVLGSPLLAQRSLHRHVRAVADALDGGGLAAGRRAVSHIVGRNPESLDEAGVIRAAIESLAENCSDAVVAPAFFGVLLGLPGMVLYKSINTADSMIGHRSARYLHFGWAAARLDDLFNLLPARLSGVLLALAAGRGAAWRAMWRDAPQHRSPNAGWPEAAMAGALGLRLAGPRVYGTIRVEDAWMGDGRADAGVADLRAALGVCRMAWVIHLVALAGVSVLLR